jgi:hypothetical protein
MQNGNNVLNNDLVGRVLRASTSGFDCGTHSTRIDDRHTFGAFVKVRVASGSKPCDAIGLIHTIRIDDDPLVRELVMAMNVDNSTLLDQRDNRMVPVETCVLNVGYIEEGMILHSLPPRPPLSLSEVYLCSAQEVYYFTQNCDFFRIVLNASEVASDDLLASSLRYAAWAYPEHERYDFVVRCGRHIARQLANDLKRLSHVLALIRP